MNAGLKEFVVVAGIFLFVKKKKKIAPKPMLILKKGYCISKQEAEPKL